MDKKLYNSPELNIVSLGQTDVVCTSNFEGYDVMEDDRVFWD